jgi:ABC-2 type transport system permease protein
MNPRRIAAVARRIAEGFRRDRRSLALLIVAPIIITALLGWVLRDQSNATTRLAIANPAGQVGDQAVSHLRDAAGQVDSSYGLTLTGDTPASLEDAKALIRDGKADVALVLPSDIPGAIQSGSLALTVVTSGTDPVSDGPRVAAVVQLLQKAAKNLAPPGAAALTPSITRETVYLSPDADQLDVLAPVFLGLFAYFFVYILTGVSFLRERVGGTLERLLATPVTRAEIVLGYSIGFSLFATIQVLVLTLFVLGHVDVPAIGPIGAWTLGLNVQSAGSPLVAFLVAVLLAIGAVNLGIFLSTFARTELQVVQFIPIVIVPQALLGGVFWPVDRLPGVLQAIAQVMPVKYAVDALREVMLKGADIGSAAVSTDLLVLAGIALFFVVLASATIKREVA